MDVAQKLRQWEATIKKDNDDVPWSLCLANHATKEFSCPKATAILHAAFQHVLHASMSWSGTRMDWFDGMGSVRNCKRRAGAGRLCWAKSIDRPWAMPAGREKKGRTKRWREGVDCAAGQDNAAGARCAWRLFLSCGAGRQPARQLRTSPKGLRRCKTRAQACSPVQQLFNSSTSSSSVTARSQGHLHHHAAAY
jgi:hypothetical protein